MLLFCPFGLLATVSGSMVGVGATGGVEEPQIGWMVPVLLEV